MTEDSASRGRLKDLSGNRSLPSEWCLSLSLGLTDLGSSGAVLSQVSLGKPLPFLSPGSTSSEAEGSPRFLPVQNRPYHSGSFPGRPGPANPAGICCLRPVPAGTTYPAGGEVAGLSPKLIDLRFCNIGSFFSLLELMLSFSEFGEMSVGLFILKPKSPGR